MFSEGVFPGRSSGEVGNHRRDLLQIEHHHLGMIRGQVFVLDQRIGRQNGFFHRAVVFKMRFALHTDPGVVRAGGHDFQIGALLKLLVDLLLVVGAEPQFAVPLHSEHEGAVFGFAVQADGGQILDGVGSEKGKGRLHNNNLRVLQSTVGG